MAAAPGVQEQESGLDGQVLCSVGQEFCSVGVNRVVNALSWSQDGAVAFGAHHMAALYDPKVRWSAGAILLHQSMQLCNGVHARMQTRAHSCMRAAAREPAHAPAHTQTRAGR